MPYWHYPCAHFHSLFPFSKHISSHWPESHEPCLFILSPIANTLLSPYISPVHSSAPALLGKISLAKFILAAIYCSLWGRLVTLVTSQQFCCQSKLEKWSNSCVLSKEDLQKDNNEVGITSTQKKSRGQERHFICLQTVSVLIQKVCLVHYSCVQCRSSHTHLLLRNGLEVALVL